MPLENICSNPLLTQGHLEHGAQTGIQLGLQHLHRWGLHNCTGQPVPVLNCPQSVKVVFMFKLNLLHLLCAHCLLCFHWEESGSVSFILPFRYLLALIKSPRPSYLQAVQSWLSQPLLTWQILQALRHLSGHSLFLFQYCGALNWMQHSRQASPGLGRGGGSPSSPQR